MNIRASYFVLPVNENIFHHYFNCTFYHFTCLIISKGDKIRITKYDYNKYFSIAVWVKPGEYYDIKEKENLQKQQRGRNVDL